MIDSELVQPHHLARKAIVYIRQSTVHQVWSNEESRRLQHAMRERAKQLGWPAALVEVVETDTGTSGATTTGRDGYKDLLSEVALGHVGLVLSYESTRLSRNCSDWYPLLDLCTLRNCLIADRDGVYDPSTVNGRMLLGMKGIVSEIELHTLRGRLTAGLLNKARRGELGLMLPVGFIRLQDGRVVKEPDQQVEHMLDLLFRTFLEVRSTHKVLRYFREHHLLLPAREPPDRTVWRQPTAAAVQRILRNPAYAGVYAYGRTEFLPGRVPQSGPRRRRRPPEEWIVLIREHHPGYVDWEGFERIQAMLTDNYAAYQRNQSRGVPREGSVLLQGIVYCGACGHKMMVQYQPEEYVCNFAAQQTQEPVCQRIPARSVDERVATAFLEALAPAELDLCERVLAERQQADVAVNKAQDQQLQRLRYEAERARRQYDQVDPENRLVASELERRWEAALNALQEAARAIDDERRERQKVIVLGVSGELRQQFEEVGQRLPQLWVEEGRLSRAQRKALLRCLIDKVVLLRSRERWSEATVRIVWRGGAVSEGVVQLGVSDLRHLADYPELERTALALIDEGRSDEEIAELLTEQGFRSARRGGWTAGRVATFRRAHGQLHRYRQRRPRRVRGFLTLGELAQILDAAPHWLYFKIKRGALRIERDEKTGLYLIPDQPELIEQLRRLRAGEIDHVTVSP